MEKIFCDRCGKEIKLGCFGRDIYFTTFLKTITLCFNCRNEFKKFMDAKK